MTEADPSTSISTVPSVESPLTTFLFVLMRDHLPTGTVRWLIEQSQLPGDPVHPVPELEALAERYATDLLLAPPRNGTADADGNGKIETSSPPVKASTPDVAAREGDPPPIEKVTTRKGRAAVMDVLECEAMKEWVGSEWMSVSDLFLYVEGVGIQSVRRNIQGLVQDGYVEARGATASRRYRSVREESAEVSSQRHDRTRISDDKVDRAREILRQNGRTKPSELDAPLDISSSTRARIIRTIREEGKLAIDYDGPQRILVWHEDGAPETSEPDPDDSGEGDVPADPEGETEEGEGASSSSAERRRPDESDSTESTQPPPRDDDGGQSGAPAAVPHAAGSRARSADEDDVELMARIGDYIQEQSPGQVFPGEVDGVFGLTPERRRRVIGMLAERHRIQVVGNGPAMRYVYRSGTGAASPDFSLPGDSPGLKLKTPTATPPPEKLSDDLEGQVKAWALRQRTFKKRAACEAFDHVDCEAIHRLLARFSSEGFLETRAPDGVGSMHYAVAAEPVNGNGNSGRRGETLEGKMMAWMSGPITADQAAAHFGIHREETVIVLNRLVTEGMVQRSSPAEGGVLYTPV